MRIANMPEEQFAVLDKLIGFADKGWGFIGDTDDPFYLVAMRLENIGFEAAHELMPCGHSRGDYRDPDYGTDKYSGKERCVGCESIEHFKQTLFLLSGEIKMLREEARRRAGRE